LPVLDKKISKEKLILSELKIFPKSVVSAEAAAEIAGIRAFFVHPGISQHGNNVMYFKDRSKFLEV
jgi:hypothetical protein